MLQQSSADVNLAVASPEILTNTEMVREFEKVVISQRREGKIIHGNLLDGRRMMQDAGFVDHDFRDIVDQLVSQDQAHRLAGNMT